MKKILIVLIASISFSLTINAQDTGPYLKFDKLVHNFGEIFQDDKAEVDFTFTNTGNTPLLLSTVRSTCGCTVPTWSKKPILPKQKGSIKVRYDSHRVGPINKQVIVESNSATGTTYLKITGKISKRPTEVMPFQNLDGSGVPFAK